MKASELRIGNILYSKLSKKEFNVVPIDIINISDEHYNVGPVILTEEWLVKFGFKIIDKNYSLNYGGESMRYAMIEKKRDSFILFFHGRFGFNLNEGRKAGDYCIQYIHQLQNLFYAITGEELTCTK